MLHVPVSHSWPAFLSGDCPLLPIVLSSATESVLSSTTENTIGKGVS